MSSPDPPPAVPISANWSPLTNDLLVEFSRPLQVAGPNPVIGWSARAQNALLEFAAPWESGAYGFNTSAYLDTPDLGPSVVSYAGGDALLRDDLGRLVPPFLDFPLTENP